MKRLLIPVAAVVLAAACGDAATTEAPSTEAPPVTAAPTTSAPSPTTAPPTTPTTAPPTTAPPSADIVPGEDPDVDAIVNAYSIAFDSTSTFDEKAPYIDDPSGLESTVDRYLETGESFGGIEVLATNVEISGDEATVFYDLLFNGNPTYPNLEGKAIRTADGWKVPRGIFCGLMASARVPCS
jgi:hypothetical protein